MARFRRDRERPTYSGLGSRIEGLLKLAEEQRDVIIAEARAEAEQIIAKARDDAEQITRAAREQANNS